MNTNTMLKLNANKYNLFWVFTNDDKSICNKYMLYAHLQKL